ncbi:Transcriptional regulatory protein SIN3 [Neolecta irregularis DAH-3]|uniref:Transcriptional regulatory protein SIN3 n=1 Tax=Neolecta irregularis (strain DAH-3) TaxID=1198029 RepID=A0A1U7LKW7_NEOID|nr:Transcriptional regulatory protein SIN3 [Neolecta irregularis DAH-3]|eukprot:OLL23300.1 Transcriptional regulatory protein SIN3 [Neolecta irregularis DAH-3]
MDISSLEPSLTPYIPEPIAPPKLVVATNEEMDFFAKVKSHINKQTTYNEFLKVCNLYSQDIIDKNTLVEKVEAFIGQDQRLMDWFKKFLGYTGEDHIIANQPTPGPRVDLNLCKAYGPSYRKLPRPEAQLPCSGRDEMCWAVLNDQWVSHPTWASEDSGFVHHKKNQYEEALLKVEEERYEYDLMIEANYRTIQLLEPIAARISGMTNEEKTNFRLPLGLGGQSVSIYQKVIKRVYDKDRGQEFIDALHEHPAHAVPVVLSRLKQKDEEWRRAQRDWNKIWRESEAKVFYKSLDHQGVNFKSVDKKAMNPRSLQLEIETIRREQLAQRSPSKRKKPQFVCKIDDPEVVQDVSRFLAVYMDTNSYSSSDRDKLDLFISNFLPLFFTRASGDEIKSPVKTTRKRKPENNSTLQNVLGKHQTGKESKETTPEMGESEMEDSEADDGVSEIDPSIAERVGETWITHGGEKQLETALSKKDDGPRKVFNFFGNSTVYIFFRYFQTIYTRLLEFKNLESFAQAERERRVPNPTAADLGLRNTRFDEVESALVASGKAYAWLLELCDKLIENESDANFEDSLRVVYGTRAYKMFTIDKVVGMLCKQILTILSDTKAAQLVVLFEKDKGMATTSTRQQMLYRLEAEELLGPEEQVYRHEWNDVEKTLSIQMIDKDDQTLNTAVTAEDRWNYYIETYALALPTEGIPRNRMSWPFLRRSIPDPEIASTRSKFAHDQISSSQGLEIKICLNTFKIFFLPNSEDSFFRKRMVLRKSKKRCEDWISWIDVQWKKGLDQTTIDKILPNGSNIFEKEDQVMGGMD